MALTQHTVDEVVAAAYEVPNSIPSGDATKLWNEVTLVTAEVSSGRITGLDYTYADSSS